MNKFISSKKIQKEFSIAKKSKKKNLRAKKKFIKKNLEKILRLKKF